MQPVPRPRRPPQWVNKAWLGGLVASIGILGLVLLGASIFMFKAEVVTMGLFAIPSVFLTVGAVFALGERLFEDPSVVWPPTRVDPTPSAPQTYYLLQPWSTDSLGAVGLLAALLTGIAFGLTLYGHCQCLASDAPVNLAELVYNDANCNVSLTTLWRRPFFASELGVYQMCADDLAFTVFYYVVFALLFLLDLGVAWLCWYQAPRTTTAAGVLDDGGGAVAMTLPHRRPPRRHAAPLDRLLRAATGGGGAGATATAIL